MLVIRKGLGNETLLQYNTGDRHWTEKEIWVGVILHMGCQERKAATGTISLNLEARHSAEYWGRGGGVAYRHWRLLAHWKFSTNFRDDDDVSCATVAPKATMNVLCER